MFARLPIHKRLVSCAAVTSAVLVVAVFASIQLRCENLLRAQEQQARQNQALAKRIDQRTLANSADQSDSARTVTTESVKSVARETSVTLFAAVISIVERSGLRCLKAGRLESATTTNADTTAEPSAVMHRIVVSGSFDQVFRACQTIEAQLPQITITRMTMERQASSTKSHWDLDLELRGRDR